MASSSSSSLSVLASSSRSYEYDVFLSFRGEDVRKGFLSHFHQALIDRQIKTYKDDTTLCKGESIAPSLVKAIEESQMAVVIFSKNYADSSWCLDELVHIMKCRHERGLMVVPIFYDVQPTDVRNQKSYFGEAFAKAKAKNVSKANLWREALVNVCNISGWELNKTADGHEAQFIKKIIDATILDGLFALNSNVNENLIGMVTRLKELESLLDIGSGGVRMVGIWGLGGSGKTTLVTSLYRKFSHHFQAHCIVGNVREKSSKDSLEKLQNIILSAHCKEDLKIQSVEDGQYKIRDMLCHRKVLLILDDVDTFNQLEALAGNHDWFGNGSRILITTRDMHLLRIHEVDHVLPSVLLSNDESMQLFNRHAFKKNSIKEYDALSSRVVSYASGLPLALKVLGSFLYGKTKNEWISALKKLEDISDPNIINILKISYDGLEAYQKELFLDIACFWRLKHEVDEAKEIFEACSYYPDIGIKVLREKSLITIDDKGMFDMHDLVQEMGHMIVKEEHPNNPEKHSRIWKVEDLKKYALENNKIEAINYGHNLLSCDSHHDIDLSCLCTIVSNMKKLRSLRLRTYDDKGGIYDENNNYKDCYDGIIFHSIELRYINWKGYPSSSPFPVTFKPVNLVVLKLEWSYQEELWKGCKHLPHLKELNLKGMAKLVKIPEIDEAVSLQKLVIEYCYELEEIHPSLANCIGLEHVSILWCIKLKVFPKFVYMKNLKRLWISWCNLSDWEIPYGLGELLNLQELHLTSNKFSRLDFSFSKLIQLKLLDLSYCDHLVELPELPSGLAILNADNCSSLTTIGNTYKSCRLLRQVSFEEGFEERRIINDGGRLLQSMLKGKSIENGSLLLNLPGVEIPKAFTPLVMRGSRYRLKLPENWCNDFSGFLICLVFKRKGYTYTYSGTCFTVSISVNQCIHSQDDVVWEEPSDRNVEDTTVGYISFGLLTNTSWWDPTYTSLFLTSNWRDLRRI